MDAKAKRAARSAELKAKRERLKQLKALSKDKDATAGTKSDKKPAATTRGEKFYYHTIEIC